MDWDDVKFFLALAGGVSLVILVVIFAVWTPNSFAEKKLCETQSVEHQWSYWFGCKVKSPGGYWVDVSDAWMLEIDPTLIKHIE